MSGEERSLPEGWAEATIGSIVDYGKTIKAEPSEIQDDEWVLELEDIERDSSRILNRVNFVNRKSKSAKNRFKAGDVLYGKLRPYLNKVVLSDSNGVCTTEIVPIDAMPFVFNAYLFWWLKHPEFLDYVARVSYGVNMPRLGTEDGNNAPFVLAPLAEQKVIADTLDGLLAQVDTLQARLDAIPAILKRFRQSVLSAAVTGKLTEEWRGERCSRNAWEVGILGDLLQEKPRNGYSPKSVEYETCVKSLSLSATTSGIFKGEFFKYIDENIPDDSYLWLEPGDILIQRANTLEYVGISAIFTGDVKKYIFPDLMMKCRANSRTTSNFLHLTILGDNVRRYFRDNATGTAGNMPKINQQTVLNAPVAIPPLPEQHEIVRRVEELFALADQIEKRVEEARSRAKHLTQSILAKAFCGELTAQWRAEHPELVSGENSAQALLERIRAARAQVPEKGKRGRKAGTDLDRAEPRSSVKKETVAAKGTKPRRRGRPKKV